MRLRRTVRWYGTRRFPRQRTFEAVCEELERLRSGPAAAKQLLLVEALLADIDAHYGVVRRLNRARRPVLLLPDVDTVAARRIIRDRLIEAYDGEARALRVYPVVVTSSQPGGATPAEGAQPPVPPDGLAEAIEERFGERVRVAEERSRGGRTPRREAGPAPPANGWGRTGRYRAAAAGGTGFGAGAYPVGRVVNVPRPWVRLRSRVA
ncbi:hypothetical protein ACFYY1_26245 [Streptomyces sp. NPDC001890]|uniref:hypothetical protein n=1 Tax=Streptomyces sp. NPDC001890 TaxID=3364620 RepID=UPI00368D9C3C